LDELNLLLRLLAGTAAGVALGWQRTLMHKSAGIRTFGLVGLGTASAAAIFADIGHIDSASRVVQGVLTGVGFLGAGLIIRRDGDPNPHGLTTAAAIWVTAALGCAAGLGQWWIVLVATAISLLLLIVDHSLEERIQRRHEGDGGQAQAKSATPPKADMPDPDGL
jgi:putative Mg2+ transporter-C (MgtC) family protein